MNTENKKSKLCFDPRVARKCIHAGCKVCDYKPYKNDPSRSVIVFEVDELFEQSFAYYTEEFKAKDEAKRAQRESIEMAE
jgi:hypothetical protein